VPNHSGAALSHELKAARARIVTRRPEICVVDDDDATRTYLRRRLAKEGYRVRSLPVTATVADEIAAAPPDILVMSLDAADPAIISSVRELSTVPIVAVSERDDEDMIVEALANGADDYIKKPFGIREFVARIQNVLRRATREPGVPPLFLSGSLKVDLVHRRVWSQGQEVHIMPKPYEVLRILVENAGKVVPHSQILEAVWGGNRWRGIGYLRLAIRELRRHLEPDPSHPTHILTERRIGYRLMAKRRPVRDNIDRGRAKRRT
jgi:two-component system, OmpR family, KDP operon response regulator KdpE